MTTPIDKGAHAGANSIDDMNLLHHGGMNRMFDRIYAPLTLGAFLQSFTSGHVRELDAVASRFLIGLDTHTPALVVCFVNSYPVVGYDFPYECSRHGATPDRR